MLRVREDMRGAVRLHRAVPLREPEPQQLVDRVIAGVSDHDLQCAIPVHLYHRGDRVYLLQVSRSTDHAAGQLYQHPLDSVRGYHRGL